MEVFPHASPLAGLVRAVALGKCEAREHSCQCRLKLPWLRRPTYPSIRSEGTQSLVSWGMIPRGLTAAAPPSATQLFFPFSFPASSCATPKSAVTFSLNPTLPRTQINPSELYAPFCSTSSVRPTNWGGTSYWKPKIPDKRPQNMMATCKACEEPLFLSVEDDEVGDEQVPDDLALSCGCHFHWYVPALQPAQKSPSLTPAYLHAPSHATRDRR